MNGNVKCPACLKNNDLEDLVNNTQYGSWTAEYENIDCLKCGHSFEVACDFLGYSPSFDTFDITEFLIFHGIKIPSALSHFWVRCYLKDLAMYGSAVLVVPSEEFKDQQMLHRCLRICYE